MGTWVGACRLDSSGHPTTSLGVSLCVQQHAQMTQRRPPRHRVVPSAGSSCLQRFDRIAVRNNACRMHVLHIYTASAPFGWGHAAADNSPHRRSTEQIPSGSSARRGERKSKEVSRSRRGLLYLSARSVLSANQPAALVLLLSLSLFLSFLSLSRVICLFFSLYFALSLD